MRRKTRFLHVARGVVVVVVEANFADGDHARLAGEARELVEPLLVERGGVVRMHAHRREHVGAVPGERHRRARRAEIAPHPDADEGADPRRFGARQDVVGARRADRRDRGGNANR